MSLNTSGRHGSYYVITQHFFMSTSWLRNGLLCFRQQTSHNHLPTSLGIPGDCQEVANQSLGPCGRGLGEKLELSHSSIVCAHHHNKICAKHFSFKIKGSKMFLFLFRCQVTVKFVLLSNWNTSSNCIEMLMVEYFTEIPLVRVVFLWYF